MEPSGSVTGMSDSHPRESWFECCVPIWTLDTTVHYCLLLF